MKKIALILGLFLAFAAKAQAGYSQTFTPEKIDEMYGKCEDMIMPMERFERTLGEVFADQHNAGRVIWCFSDKIKQHSTPQQFELYEKAKTQAEEFLDALLYYKGYWTIYTEQSELMYRYQSFIYYALTENKDFALPEPDKINCPLNDKITDVPICLKQDILKICNIESRRNVIYHLNNLTQTTLEFLKTITDDEKKLKKQMQQYYNMIFHFVVLIRESYLMNPLDSWMYMGDVYLYEEMNGLEHKEAEEMKEPYPLPFP
ncbi:MAG: hypothetical protein IKR92_02480 [Alphaproteobacteria bacterium]|nr:hypothetical protein [Alphaproteobacteria bacterium]MBR6355698.1 hypothetical protein [Alphaproteobacteria bacterium]